jgi:hypothetical protein
MKKIMLLAFLLPIGWSVELPPTERAIRLLIVDENGKPANGVPIKWIASVENGVNLYGGRTSKEVARKTLLSEKTGVVEIPQHRFSFLNIGIDTEALKNSTVWMVDSKTNPQHLGWDVYRIDNLPQASTRCSKCYRSKASPTWCATIRHTNRSPATVRRCPYGCWATCWGNGQRR